MGKDFHLWMNMRTLTGCAVVTQALWGLSSGSEFGHSGIVYMELHQLRTESGRLEGTSAKDVGVWGHGKGCHGPSVLFSLQEKLQLRGTLLVLGLTYSCHMC